LQDGQGRRLGDCPDEYGSGKVDGKKGRSRNKEKVLLPQDHRVSSNRGMEKENFAKKIKLRTYLVMPPSCQSDSFRARNPSHKESPDFFDLRLPRKVPGNLVGMAKKVKNVSSVSQNVWRGNGSKGKELKNALSKLKRPSATRGDLGEDR